MILTDFPGVLRSAAVVAAVSLGLALAQPAVAQPARNAPDSFAELVDKLMPTVVNITTTQNVPQQGPRLRDLPQLPPGSPFEELFKEFFDKRGGEEQKRRGTSLGSGFVIDPDGYIITNNHVIQGAEDITVILRDDTQLKAKLIGSDSRVDVAVLKVEPPNKKPLPAAKFGDSDKARVGDWVIAIGNPYGLGGTVTAGIVSAIHRGIPGATPGAYDRYIQTDAAINMGNSGGPMFDLNGNVIGINAALISPTGASVGIGLAIPAELAKPVIDSLRRGQRPSRGYLGAGLQALDEDLAPSLGLPKDSGEIVRSVVPGGPGARAGLQQGDVIVKVNSQPVTPDQTVSYLVANTQAGSRVPFEIIRAGKRATLMIQVGERPPEDQLAQIGSGATPNGAPDSSAAAPQRALGLSLTALTPELARAANLPAGTRGVIITAVDPNSDASDKGLQRGDLILSVNNQLVTTPAQVVAAVDVARKAGRSSVLLLAKRGNTPEQFIGVDIGNR